jgi:hypothetical protein
MHRKKFSRSAAYRPNWPRLLKGTCQKIFLLNAIDVDTSDSLTRRSSRCRTTTGAEHTSLFLRRGGHVPPAWLPRSHSSTSVQPTRRAMTVSFCLCGTANSPRYSAPMRTGIQGITLDILLCHDGERSWMPNARFQLLPGAEAKRRLLAVGCTPWLGVPPIAVATSKGRSVGLLGLTGAYGLAAVKMYSFKLKK